MPAGRARDWLYETAAAATRRGLLLILWDKAECRPTRRAYVAKHEKACEIHDGTGRYEVVGVFSMDSNVDDFVNMLLEELEPYGWWC